MQSLSKHDNPKFGRQMLIGIVASFSAGALMAIILVLIGMVTYYSRIEGW